MKLTNTCSALGIFSISLIIMLASCSSKQSNDQGGSLTDLADFPKEWILIEDIAPPDSISRNYVVILDSSSSFLGSSIIKQNGSHWQMTNSGFYYPGTYLIKNCVRSNEGDVVYYDFDLQNTQDTTTLRLKVNFRHNPGQADDVPSVFTCSSCDGNQDVLMAEKRLAGKFPKKTLESLQYD
jgi:hypothetical protein